MSGSSVDLVKLFNSVSKVLKENQESLNEADTYNHNQGDNMVKNFKVISKAVKQKKDASPSEQLSYASEMLQQSSSTSSARICSQGLSQAANQFQGQPAVTDKNAISLVQALMGGQQTEQPTQNVPNDMVGQLMGTLLGGGGSPLPDSQLAQTQSTNMLSGLMGALLGGGKSISPVSHPAETPSADMLSGLMGALLGGGEAASTSHSKPANQVEGGIDLINLLTAGLAYMQAKQKGASSLEALIQAVMAGSQMNDSPSHSQSSQLVASTLLSTMGTMLGGKKQ